MSLKCDIATDINCLFQVSKTKSKQKNNNRINKTRGKKEEETNKQTKSVQQDIFILSLRE